MATLNCDSIVETTEIIRSVKELRARKQVINAEIDSLKLQPDVISVPNDEKFLQLEQLKAERASINLILQSVNLT